MSIDNQQGAPAPQHTWPPRAAELVLLELSRFWEFYNWQYLGSKLRQPGFELTAGNGSLGSYDGERRVIRIAAEHVRRDPWLGVMETLRHEMAHQYVQEVMGNADAAPHGALFREACHLLRVSPAASGTGTEATHSEGYGPASEDSIRSRVAKLLSLAGSPNEHEAQLAMLKARQLLLKHNLTLLDLDRGQRRYGERRLGGCKARWQRHEYTCGTILRRFFFVETLWTMSFDPIQLKRGTELSIHGTLENLDMAEYVYRFIDGLLPGLWVDYKQRTQTRSDRGRLHFFWGVAVGFLQKLEQQGAELEQSEALVWRGDPGLSAFLKHLHPRIVHQRSGEVGVHSSYADGVQQGHKVVLQKPLGGTAISRGRLLAG